MRFLKQRRFIRYSLLALNVLILGGIIFFVGQAPPESSNRANTSSVGEDAPTDPLDQLSSADIAVNLAQMTSLPEATAVVNQADSVGAELAVPPASAAVIAKPQTVSTDLKSYKDIKSYVVAAGDTVGSVAAKFGVTSDSIVWSNNLSGANVGLSVGGKLIIPPVNGIVYTVKAGDTPDSLAQKYRANKEQIIAYNDAELTGLVLGRQIIIPNGQQPSLVASRSSGSYSLFFGGGDYNGYDRGFCTWYVAKKRAEIGRPVPGGLGNASTWDNRAPAAGLVVNRTPSYGAAVVTSQRGAGHVAFVERVNADGSIWISEMNSRGQRSIEDPTPAGGWNKVDFKLIPAATAAGYNYIH
ncbi:MAG TPA: CHAP domain-containing protein [Candidatus Saccharimonadales bacterium]|nr:CHAP domain-containing protein [Candidatus Saccharimonadales bacterium]